MYLQLDQQWDPGVAYSLTSVERKDSLQWYFVGFLRRWRLNVLGCTPMILKGERKVGIL